MHSHFVAAHQGSKRRSTCTNNQETVARYVRNACLWSTSNGHLRCCDIRYKKSIHTVTFAAEWSRRFRCRWFVTYRCARAGSCSGQAIPCVVTKGRVLPSIPSLLGLCCQSSCSWIGLTKNFKVREDDEDEVPRFIPYFGDSTSAVRRHSLPASVP
jgi:hypothetical protein